MCVYSVISSSTSVVFSVVQKDTHTHRHIHHRPHHIWSPTLSHSFPRPQFSPSLPFLSLPDWSSQQLLSAQLEPRKKHCLLLTLGYLFPLLIDALQLEEAKMTVAAAADACCCCRLQTVPLLPKFHFDTRHLVTTCSALPPRPPPLAFLFLSLRLASSHS